MLEKTEGMLAGIEADYADIRFERMRTTSADIVNDKLKGVDSVSTGRVRGRVIRKDGFASATATRREDVRKRSGWLPTAPE
jgi:predicted Zn-dependent protease